MNNQAVNQTTKEETRLIFKCTGISEYFLTMNHSVWGYKIKQAPHNTIQY